MKIEIGLQVISSKFGKGVINSIITKSTGYVEVFFQNGLVKKEMAFNLTDENGVSLKEKKVTATSGMNKLQKKNYKIKNCDNSGMNSFNNNLKQALMNETGRVGSLEFLKSI